MGESEGAVVGVVGELWWGDGLDGECGGLRGCALLCGKEWSGGKVGADDVERRGGRGGVEVTGCIAIMMGGRWWRGRHMTASQNGTGADIEGDVRAGT